MTTDDLDIWGADRSRLRLAAELKVPLERDTTTDEFTVVVPGEVRGHGRPRATVGKQGRARAYTAKVDLDHRGRVEAAWLTDGAPRLPDAAYYECRIVALMSRPATHFKKDGDLSASGKRAPYPGKPDLDNVAKLIDVFVKSGAVPDDARLVNLGVTKRYRGEDELGGTYFNFRIVEAPHGPE